MRRAASPVTTAASRQRIARAVSHHEAGFTHVQKTPAGELRRRVSPEKGRERLFEPIRLTACLQAPFVRMRLLVRQNRCTIRLLTGQARAGNGD